MISVYKTTTNKYYSDKNNYQVNFFPIYIYIYTQLLDIEISFNLITNNYN